MVALSRLKATFEACPGLFSPKHRLASREGVAWRNRAAAWGALSHFKDVSATAWRSDCGKCTSEDHLSQRALCMQAIWSWSGEKTSFFGKWRWLGQRPAYGQARGYMWVMPFTGFSTTSTLTPVDTLRAFEAAARLMCHATAPLLNRTPAFVHWLQELRAFPFLIWGHHHGSWMECARNYQPTVLVQPEKVFQSKLTAWQESRVGWRQNSSNLPHWASAVNMVLLIQPSSAAAEWAFSLLRAAFSGQQQAAFKIMWRAAWCFTAIITETIMLMCSS